jgi:antitoxin (DNA-binding transcriptional repressor) of toxin-antitoxin stability system
MCFNNSMTATLEQTQSDLLMLINLVQQVEEVVITNHGRAVAKLSAVPQSTPSPNRQAWLARLAELREQLSTGRNGPTVEQILEEDRSERST